MRVSENLAKVGGRGSSTKVRMASGGRDGLSTASLPPDKVTVA